MDLYVNGGNYRRCDNCGEFPKGAYWLDETHNECFCCRDFLHRSLRRYLERLKEKKESSSSVKETEKIRIRFRIPDKAERNEEYGCSGAFGQLAEWPEYEKEYIVGTFGENAGIEIIKDHPFAAP